MGRRLLLSVAVVAAVLVTACSSGAGALTGKTWQLTAITEKTPAFQGVVPTADQARYTITFNTDGSFNATADCNLVAGTYTTSGSTLTIKPGPSTLVACPEGSFGDLYAHALGNAASYAIANDQLTITLADGGTLTFAVGSGPASTAAGSAPASSAPAASGAGGGTDLQGKTWMLTAITEKTPAFQGVVPTAEQANYTIEFKADGTFQAKADCNQVSGTYAVTGSGGLQITPGPSTLVACAEGSLGDLFVLGLGNAASYAIANDQLTITLADGGTLVFA